MEVRGLGLWGAGRGTFKADTITFRVESRDGTPKLAIAGAYVKGLLRGWAYRVAPLLKRAGLLTAPVREECWVGETCSPGGEVCAVCAVFGFSGGPKAPLEVTDFYAVRREALDRVKGVDLEELLLRDDVWAPDVTTYVTHVRICDWSGKAAEGGLFVNEAVLPGTLFLGEVRLFEGLLEGVEPVEAYRLLLASLAQLNYSYVGRRTLAKVSVVEEDIGDAARDPACSLLLEALRGGER